MGIDGMQNLVLLEHYDKAVEENDAMAVYFYGDNCSACLALRPKITGLLSREFPFIKLFSVDAEKYTEICAQKSVMTIPALLVYFGGREAVRKGRYLSLSQLENEIRRPYEMVFE